MKVPVEIVPFEVPDAVSMRLPAGNRQDGWKESPRLPLKDLEAAALCELCDDFRKAVFEKAGKADPRRRPDDA